MPVILSIIRKLLIFFAPVIIGWIWDKAVNKSTKKKSQKPRGNIVKGKIVK